MASEIVGQIDLIAGYGGLILEVAILTVMGISAYYIQRDHKRLDSDLTEFREIVPLVISHESEISQIKEDVSDNKNEIKEMRSQIVENQKTLTDTVAGVDRKIDLLIAYLEGKDEVKKSARQDDE